MKKNQSNKKNLIKHNSDLVALEYDITYNPIEDKNVEENTLSFNF